jgi:hypothetical protein
LTGHFNRNFRNQEIDGELRRPLRIEPAIGVDAAKTSVSARRVQESRAARPPQRVA